MICLTKYSLQITVVVSICVGQHADKLVYVDFTLNNIKFKYIPVVIIYVYYVTIKYKIYK